MGNLDSIINSARIFRPDVAKDEWNEADHPRGNSDNAGQFAPKSGASSAHTHKSSPKKRTWVFSVGGVNSLTPGHPDIKETTASSFAEAVNFASHYACNGDRRFYKTTWVKLVSVDGHKPKKDVIIDNGDPRIKEKIRSIGNGIQAFFDRKEGNPSDDGSGSQHTTPDPTTNQHDPNGNIGVRNANPNGQGGSVGRTGHTDQGGTPPGGTPKGKIVQPDLPFAQDSAIPKKKVFFRDLIRSLRNISADFANNPRDEKSEPSREAEHRAQTRAREALGKNEVISTTPNDPSVVRGLLKPAEVRGIISKSCSLIKTVDKDMIPGIERRIKRIFEKGNSTPETLARYLEQSCDLEPWQADRIVRDQMNKYQSASSLEAMKKQGVKLVRWCHGDCKDPRPYHIRHWDGHSGLRNGHPNGLAGFVFSIDNPPIIDEKTGERGFPGDLCMCSCYLEAVK